MELSFYKDKRVLVTGHTGFKGTWLCKMLVNAGAVVTGYSLEPPTEPNLFSISDLDNKMKSVIADIRDIDKLKFVFAEVQPEIVLHLAAQPIVRESYKDPRRTYETNVMGTVNLMECVRLNPCVRSVLNVTTDKVYKNNEWCWGYREDEPLDGFDPYSNSKSCSELVTHSYINSFFAGRDIAVSTARAGNVIGGGDFASDRIIPDCVRAMKSGKKIGVRNPYSTRPYQHVLEPLSVYLMIAAKQYEDKRYAGFYNIGPDDCDCVTTGDLVDLFCKYWGDGAEWVNQAEKNAPHEANFLKLDCSKLKRVFDWKPRWHIDECMKYTTRFYKTWLAGESIPAEMDREIEEYKMEKKLQLLDCTLRDGGYINDWDFGHSTIVNVFERQVSSNVDIIEVGFIDDRREFDINRTIQPDTASFDYIFKNLNHGGSMLVAMIDYGTCSIDNVSECDRSCLDGIRVIFKKEKMKQAIDYCKQIKEKGYKVFVQAVSITSYSDNELEKLVSLVNDCAPYAMSMVDTYGLLDSEMLLHIISVIDPILNSDIMLGFHAHNNFQLGFSNAVTVLNSGIARGILVDGSLYGMGKSAGNAPIELIAMYMNGHCKKHYNIDQMQEAIATGLLDIFRVEPWGYTLFYYIAASNGCHPNYVSYLINKRTLSITAVNEILQMIPKELKLEKDTDMLEQLYLDYQDRMCNDKVHLERLKREFDNKIIMAVGPGTSITDRGEVIRDYININKPIVIAVNYIPENLKPDYLFLTNSLRYRQMSSQLQNTNGIHIIATSNVTKTDGKFDYVLNYSGLIDRCSLVPDNSLLMMVKLLERLGVKSVSLAGFDGYSANEINYFQSGMEYEFAIKHAEELNAFVKNKFAETEINIQFVTESKYQ